MHFFYDVVDWVGGYPYDMRRPPKWKQCVVPLGSGWCGPSSQLCRPAAMNWCSLSMPSTGPKACRDGVRSK